MRGQSAPPPRRFQARRRSIATAASVRLARGSIVAERDLAEGHVIAEADIWARRPGSGEIPVYDFERVIGRRLTRAVTRNTQLKWSDLA